MILLTGATGLIGNFIAKKLIENNLACKVLVRDPTQFSLKGVEIVEGDVLDIVSVERAFEGVDQVIHCAAIVSFGEEKVERMFKVNVEGTANMVNVALSKKIKKFIYLSSVAALGRDSKTKIITEDAKWVTSPLNSKYAISKYMAELEVWRGAEEGLNVSMLCPTVVMGPGDWNKSSTKIFKNIHEGMRFYPSGSTNVVDVRDVADACFLMLNSDRNNEKFILNAGQILYNDFFSKIAEGFGKRKPEIRLTKNMIMPFYYLLRIIAPFYLKKRFINAETITISNSHFAYDNSRFKKDYQFEYRSIDESIAWTCKSILEKQVNNI